MASNAVVHLELHTDDLAEARGLYAELCGWPEERVGSGKASYLALELGRLGGGIVECATAHPVWIPYVEVRRIEEITEHARRLGAKVLLRAARGRKWVAERGDHGAGWRDRVLAAEARADPMTGGVVDEATLLEAARAGDEDAYAALVEEHRASLHAHCYRMLGSVPDAEDALQEALLGAWRGLSRFEGRSSLRTWLYTIATNACLKAIERRPKRVMPVDFGPSGDPHVDLDEPLVESVWVGPYPADRYEQRESVELAFIVALQHLPARQRAVLILRDVLGFSGAEVAEALEMSPAAVYSALQRAHRGVEERVPRTEPAGHRRRPW